MALSIRDPVAPSDEALQRAQRRVLVAAVVLVLLFRGVYLWRFGWDSYWMNQNFLVEARALWLGTTAEPNGLPGVPLLLCLAHACGLSPLASLAVLHLTGHLLFVAGSLRLAYLLWPRGGTRRWGTLAVVLTVAPILSSSEGYKNLATLLGSAVAICGLAAVARAAANASLARLLGVLCLGGLAATLRPEAAATLVGAAVLLAAFGPRMGQMPSARVTAAALAGGVMLGAGFVALVRALNPSFQVHEGNYLYHTFYDGLPWLMWPAGIESSDVHRYLASMQLFGSMAENGGSLLSALLQNPGLAIWRLVAKLPDLFGVLFWLDALTPLALGLALVGLWQIRRGHGWLRHPAWLLLAFAAPLLILLGPTATPHYSQAFVLPVVLAVVLGAERALRRAGKRAVLAVAAVVLVGGLGYVALFGKREDTTSRVFARAGRYLEERCAQACLTNWVPTALLSEAWADLEAGAPLPRKIKRTEGAVTGRLPPGFAAACDFDRRRRLARAHGYVGPILYVQLRLAQSTRAIQPVLDREPQLEGAVDLSRATLEARFSHGAEEVLVWRL